MLPVGLDLALDVNPCMFRVLLRSVMLPLGLFALSVTVFSPLSLF